MGIFNAAVCTIFAREVLEATLIIGQYRAVIKKSPEFADEVKKNEALRAVTISALIASLAAIVLIIAIAIPLGLLSKDFDDRASNIIEGVSKIVAAICIGQLSIKWPKWLGYYASKKIKDGRLVEGLSMKSIKFNVAWNIWREVAEVGVFLIPFFLDQDALIEIPLSSVIGIVVGLISGLGIYYASMNMEDKFWLTVFLSSITGLLSTGLFTGGMHKFEMVGWGSTPVVWKLEGKFWDQNRLPMTIFKPFGYSSTRTVLHMVCFWSWLFSLITLHYWKYKKSQEIFAQRKADEEAEAEREEILKEEIDEETAETPKEVSLRSDDASDTELNVSLDA